ncbi:MAG: ABC transporter ATP-binding protein/permease [Oscillospiraceae bacterium]|nr:ABC transporter ATP-binding protein/permease [Oscillospiraceae bacterium]
MLELKQIVKNYPAGDGQVHALRGIDLQFRKSEFVSILGPSGCGKTTMLNIIGGLDQYTSGDLVINGRSTKDFKDRDWDAYRNHSIGFVFQSYNLIPHQSVLQNVELALTLSGVSKQERRKRAKKALEDVGLGDQLRKKPGEMSGGQMQRVAIARALVNDPDIILADEPTGALDTETSLQVMEILKNVAKDRLVVMVTHNPELAEKYSTRIIRMLDGVITGDSMPVTEREVEVAPQKVQGKIKKPSMSLGTAFMLSLKNLFTKKGRTMLTAFAGSIGIIGIALILAISQGMTTYIDTVQEEALSSYPLTIQDATIDISSLMTTFMGMDSQDDAHDLDHVYKKSAIYDMINALNSLDMLENDLKSFKQFLEYQMSDKESTLYPAVSGIQYTYNLPLMVYTKNLDGNIIPSDTQELMSAMIAEYMGADISAMMGGNMGGTGIIGSMASSSSTMQQSAMSLWQEMLEGKDGSAISPVLKHQYDVVYGDWPNSYNEIVLVVDRNNELDDMTLYAMGLLAEEDIDKIMAAAMDGTILEKDEKKWTFEEICKQEYRVILNSSCYVYDEATGLYKDLRDTEAGIRLLYDKGLVLKVVGIIRPNENAGSTMLSGSIGYTKALTEYVITQSQNSSAIEAQRENSKIDVITGLPFQENTGNLTNAQKAEDFRNHIAGMTDEEKVTAYIQIKSIPSDEVLQQQVSQALSGMTRDDMESTLVQALTAQMGVSGDEITSYVSNMTDEEITEIFTQIAMEQAKQTYAQMVAENMNKVLESMGPAVLVMQLEKEMGEYTEEQFGKYYDEIMEFSKSSLEDNLLELGYVDLDEPSTVNIFASSFANKDIIEEEIALYNEGKDELEKIKYTDYIGIMLSSVTAIINAITYVLIAFVAISLVVSSIMIGVITLISVQERTKEIGILRAIGASKKNVSSMFTAETVIIGFAAGLLGIVVTYLLCIPINAIINHLTGIPNLDAILPLGAAVILIGISVVLTLIAGMIPSRSAAKKDPVVALRTE